jgi:hypothetical protein
MTSTRFRKQFLGSAIAIADDQISRRDRTKHLQSRTANTRLGRQKNYRFKDFVDKPMDKPMENQNHRNSTIHCFQHGQHR